MPLTVQEINTFAAMAEIRAAWLALRQAEAQSNVYTHPDWIAAWQYLPSTGKPIILAAWDGGVLFGVAAFHIQRLGYRGIPLNRIEFIGDSPLNDFLIRGSDRRKEVVRAFVDRLCGRDRVWDLVDLRRIEQGSACLALLPGAIKDLGLSGIHEEEDSPNGICLTDDWDAYLRRRSRGFRKDVRGRRNRLQRLEGLSIRRYSGLEDRYDEAGSREKLDVLFRDAIACSGRSWQGKSTEGTAISDEPAYRFFREIIHTFASMNMLLFQVLYTDVRPIAFHLSLFEGRRIMDYKAGFDSAFKRYGPGGHIFMTLLEYAAKNGFLEVDLMSIEKGQQYKYRYAEKIYETTRITVFNRTLKGRLARLMMKQVAPRLKSLR